MTGGVDGKRICYTGGPPHPVLDDRGRLVGMLSERDLRSRLGTDVQDFPDATLEALSEPVSEAMTRDPTTLVTTIQTKMLAGSHAARGWRSPAPLHIVPTRSCRGRWRPRKCRRA